MSNRLAALLPQLPANARPILLTTAYGLCGGLAAVVFEVGISLFYNGTFVRFAKLSPGGFLAASFAVIVLTSLIAGLLLSRFCPPDRRGPCALDCSGGVPPDEGLSIKIACAAGVH